MAHPELLSLPLHSRIQRTLRQLILEGALGAGSALPASRLLARSLGVSRDTIESAYSHLHAEGFIERRVGSGSFVAEATRLSPGRRTRRRLSGAPPGAANLSQRGQAMLDNGGVREQLAPRPFAPGVPETRTFPLSTWERLQRQVLKEFGPRALLHGDPQGMQPLRQAIADYVNLERGARTTADQVLVLTSSQQALGLCANVLLDAGERIFIEDPVYYGARKAFAAAGLDCQAIPVDAQGIRVDELLAHPHPAKVVYLTPPLVIGEADLADPVAPVPQRGHPVPGAAPVADRMGATRAGLDHRGRLRQRIPLRRQTHGLRAGPGRP